METTIMNNMCRCCASEGAFKDIKTTYRWMGEDEVYGDMLKDCFDITLSASDSESGICEVCITQLRNAANFKKQVLHTEEQFLKHGQNKLFKPNIVKVELPVEDVLDGDDNNLSGDDAFSGAEYELPIKTEKVEEPKTKKRAAAKASTSRSKKQKTSDGEDTPAKSGRQNDITKSVPENNEAVKFNLSTEGESNTAPKAEIVKHRHNITQILLCSNATPIRKYGGIGYTCCYCEEQYQQATQLKKHTLETHTDVSQANFMKNMNTSDYLVKLDITSLRCKLCSSDIDTLEEFMNHLNKKHDINIFTEIKNHIFPFKLEGDILKCSICSSDFTKFRVLVSHMHKHYRNFVCTTCDLGFVNRNSLAQHSERHRTGSYRCAHCPKILDTHIKKKIHERTQHTHCGQYYKCGYCCEPFKDYWKKEAHLTEVHGVKNLTPICQACDKVFNSRKSLNIHTRRDHLMERPHKCTECDKKFFSTTGLKNHVVIHTKSRAFRCEVCLKSFGRQKTLNCHKKIHTAVQKYKCKHCEEPFQKKCNWRKHMRNKHDEIV
ncbi:zinc finger protein 708 isoform X6 [Manduca sexta]|uniref:zinc finger protein 708 isoform X6 n=1 Tax=Manduca sexta TaxID=7130 RepID=UPI001183080B|nr:zinc finger protein 708 isoform X6 [Manduca sexta]